MEQTPYSTPRTSISMSIGDSSELDANFSLSEKLKVFKGSSFKPEAYVTTKSRSMAEKVSCMHSMPFIFVVFSFCLILLLF